MSYPGWFRSGGLAGGLLVSLWAGCGQDTYHGSVFRITGSFNNGARGERAPALTWNDSAQVYQGIVALPGDALQVRLFAPMDDTLIGGLATEPAAVPGSLPTAAAADGAKRELLVDTPLAGLYQVTFDPARRQLRVDLAPSAEQGRDPATTALIRALRGADQADAAEKQRRADALIAAFSAPEAPPTPRLQTPLRTSQSDGDVVTYKSVTFLQLGSIDSVDVPDTLSVVGDFNDWTEGRDPMRLVLDRRIAYRARQSSVRMEYRLALHGQRHTDPFNPEIVWDGASLPPNLRNLLGGNVGDFNSVAVSPDTDQGSRLQRLVIPMAGQPSREVYVYLPRGYALSDKRFPSLYLHDGKDAIVRGRYNQILDQLIADQKIPPLLAIFIPAESDATARLVAYSHFNDPYFLQSGTTVPKGQDYAAFLNDVLVPTIDKKYRTVNSPDQRAMLGIDMAGPFTFYVGWSDGSKFQRLASQSGRFGWGVTAQAAMIPPYVGYLSKYDRSASMKKLSLDWADMDQFQVAANDQIQKLLAGTPGYATKTRFYRQDKPLNLPNPDAWDNWRSRLDGSLTFLLGDLVGN